MDPRFRPTDRPARRRVARTPAALLALALAGSAAPTVLLASAATAAPVADPSVVGRFAAAFEQTGPACTKDADQRSRCKPAVASVMQLPNGKTYYWDALEGSEDVRYNQVLEYGHQAQNDSSRVLTLGPGDRPSWSTPRLADSGTNPGGNPNAEYLPGVPRDNAAKNNDGDLFCSDQVFLADGRILDAGGTSYYGEPSVPGTHYGAVELEGLKNSRIFDPADASWKAGAFMAYGRWYPALVTLPSGDVFVASGVTKLIKPVYPNRPGDSGTNVLQTETFRARTGRWTDNGTGAKRDLPLFPRLHLLPDGHVYFDAGGQTFNPQGQSTGEAGWNMTSSYDPVRRQWTDLGLPEFGNGLKGFRGSTFSQMLPLRPDADGRYTKAQFLSAGGVYGVAPGTYLGSKTANVNTVDLSSGKEVFSSVATGSLSAPRWYGSGVSLPTGQVIAFNGADRDEVVLPGSGTAVMTPEMYDPAAGTWTRLAPQAHGRTYHNTASLMPDGRVMVAGHAPINTGYAFQTDTGRRQAGLSAAFRDPSIEIYSPPNLFYGARPVITRWNESVARGSTMTLGVTDARSVASVVLVRNTATTHLVDGDQRTVELPVLRRTADTVTVAVTGEAAVLPAGPYMLFANKTTPKGLTPSVSRQVFVGRSVPASIAGQLHAANASRLALELAAVPVAATTKGESDTGTTRPRTAAPGRAVAPALPGAPTAAGPAPAVPTDRAAAGQAPTLDPAALRGPARSRPLPAWPAALVLAAAGAWGGLRRMGRR